MNPIAFGQPAAQQPTAYRPPTAAASTAHAPESSDDLRSEDAAVRTSVGALDRYAANFVAAPAAPATPAAPTAPLPPFGASSGSSSASAFTPTRTWASMVGQSGPGGANPGAAADQGMSQILDAGDVFASDGD